MIVQDFTQINNYRIDIPTLFAIIRRQSQRYLDGFGINMAPIVTTGIYPAAGFPAGTFIPTAPFMIHMSDERFGIDRIRKLPVVIDGINRYLLCLRSKGHICKYGRISNLSCLLTRRRLRPYGSRLHFFGLYK